MTDLSLRILLEAQDSASAIVSHLGSAISQLASGNVLGGVAGIAATAATAVIGFGVASVKAAGDFQQMTNTLVTSAGESAQNLDMVRKGILDISVSTATSTDQLTKAMYQIESSGQHGSNGLTVLKAAAQGAKAENADLEVVAKALTTVLTDYHMKASDSTQAMNGLIATVSAGKTTLQELSGSMGAVLPIASALGVSFPQVAGAMATMTNAGMSARQAAQNLAHVLLGLQSPNGVAVKSMQNVGLSAQQVKDALVHQGLPEALQMIEDHVGKKFPASSVDYQTALKNILGGQVGFKLAAMLTGQSLKDTEDHIRSVSAAMNQGGSAVAGFDVVQQSFNFRLEQAKQAWNALLIQVGTALLPVLTQVMGAITPLITGFATWLTKSNVLGQGLSALGTIIGNVWKYLNSDRFAGVIADFQTIGNQIGRLIGPALAQIGPLIGAAFSAIGPLLTNVVIPAIDTVAFVIGQFLEHLNEDQPFWHNLLQILQQIGSFLASTFQPVWDQLVQTFNTQLKPAWDQLMKSLQPMMPELQAFATVIGGVLVASIILGVGVIAGLAKAFAALLIGAIKAFGGIVQAVTGAVQIVSGVISFLVDLITGKWDRLGNDLKLIWQGIVNVVQGSWTAITSIIGGAINAIGGFVSGFVSTITNAFNAVSRFAGGLHIPGFASGTGPGGAPGGLALVGENGPELMNLPAGTTVTPLSQLSRTAGASSSTTTSGGHIFNITINTGYLKDRTAVSQLTDVLVQEISRRTRGSGNFITWTSGGKA